MNYVMSHSELQTMAAIQGADRLLLAAETGALTRRTAVDAIFQLVRRGLLTPGAEGFHCEPEVRSAVRLMLRAESCVLVTDPSRALPQMLGYFSPDGGAVTENVPQRPGECRLRICQPEDFPALLEEAGYLPEEDAPIPEDGSVPVPAYADLELTELCELPGLRVSLDRLDPRTGDRLDRAAVLFCDGADRISVNDSPALPWRQSLLLELMKSWTGGEWHDPGGRLCSADGKNL